LHSGHLAARAIHEHLDYAQLVSRELRPLVRASIVNRLLYDRVGNRAYTALIRHFAASRDLASRIRPWYRGLPLHRFIWPLAERRYRSSQIR
jgi:hypothetical protein